MNTPTNFGKFGLRSQPWRAFFALFTILVGMGASQVALGQVSEIGTTRSILVNTGSGNVTYNAFLNTPTGTAAPAGEFDERNFGTFNFSGGVLSLNGGTFTVTERDGDVFTRGFINYTVFQGILSPATTATGSAVSGRIQLQDNGVDVNGVRTFSLSTAAENILSKATTGGAGTNYRFDISFSAEGIDGGGIETTLTTGVSSGGSRSAARRSQFRATGTPLPPPPMATSTIRLQNVGVTKNAGPGTFGSFPTGSSLLNIDPSVVPGPGVFQNTDFGTFDVDAGEMLLNGGTVEIEVRNNEVFTSATLDFRVFQGDLNSPLNPVFQSLQLQPVGNGPVNGIRTFTLTTEQLNIIQLAFGDNAVAKTFRFDTRLTVSGSDASARSITLGGTPRNSTFTVTGIIPIPAVDTQWKGINDNWFDPVNWTNGIPTPDINAVIPDFGAELAGAIYPNIRQEQAPLVNGVRTPARCRDLTMNGTTQLQRSICRLVTGHLEVYGNFNNLQDSFIQRTNVGDFSVLVFAGRRLQTITGGLFTSVEIRGIGDKRIINRMIIQTQLQFFPGAGNVLTDISAPTRSLVELTDRGTLNAQNGAQLVNESDDSKIVGFVITSRTNVKVGEARTYGNMGMEIQFTSGSGNPGNVTVTRNTAENYAPVINRYGIRRVFGVRPSDTGAQFGDLTATIRFSYLDGETINLRTDPNAPSTQGGSGAIDESTLSIYLSTNSGNSFRNLGRTSNSTTQNFVEKVGVTSFATFTLSDMTPGSGLPLPVVLAAFDVKKVGADALLTWITATEKNSKGFEVQVSTDGTNFRTMGFVASQLANSSAPLDYRFIDAEPAKGGVRYYRLHQMDLDGKSSISPVKVLDFGSAAPVEVATLLAYPNPFTSDLSVSVGGAGIGKANLRLADLTGRTIRSQVVSLESGSGTIPLTNLGELKAGVYIVQLTLPSGKTQNFKVQKQ